jgi:ribosomal protein S10
MLYLISRAQSINPFTDDKSKEAFKQRIHGRLKKAQENQVDN